MKYAILVLSVLVLAGAAFSQQASVNTAIVVTDITSVDSATAGAASSAAGAPVIQTYEGELSDSAVSDMKSYGVRNVIIIGGPEVVKWSAEDKLKSSGIKVARLWGMERTGTAVEAAKHFWSGGASCAVVASDTKDSDADIRRQAAGSNLAASMNCAFVPVPEGTLPAEVLSTLSELNVSSVWYIGPRPSDEIRSKLAAFRLREITGSDEEVADGAEAEIESALPKAKMVIIAVDGWRSATGAYANPTGSSVVRFVSSVDQLPQLISRIKERNITDVRVVGIPQLAQQIAESLSAAGINATKVSGQNSSDISMKLFSETRAEWRGLRDKAELEENRAVMKTKRYLLSRLSGIEDELDSAEAEADSSGAADVKAAIAALQARISYVRSSLLTNEIKKAKEVLADIINSMKKERFENREKLGIYAAAEISAEEDGLEGSESGIESAISKADTDAVRIGDKCNNSETVRRIIEKARETRKSAQEARVSGDYARAAELLADARQLMKTVGRTIMACNSGKAAPAAALEIAGRHGVDIRKPSRTSVTVEITGSGFSPKEANITKGGKVIFVNTDSASHWPATAVHPTHTAYPGSDISKCGTEAAKDIFDSCRGLGNGEKYEFVFLYNGTWKYHDHTNPSLTGVINVA